jgi:hypothetical protein
MGSELVQPLLRDEKERDGAGPGFADDLADPMGPRLFLDEDLPDAVGRGFQDLKEGVQAADLFHGRAEPIIMQ